MEWVDFPAIISAIRKAGIKSGDIINVHSRLFAIGAVRGIRSSADIPDVYLNSFREVTECNGTVVVPTYTTSFARFGTPFVLEKSPSEMGVFSEHVRRASGSCRTLHPVQSLTALGGQADLLARNHPRWNVGHDTIWDRMLQRGGKFVGLGIPPQRSLSFMHQVEFLACVPYLYHKVLRGTVYANGGPVSHEFLMAVRYISYNIVYDLSRLEADLGAAGAIEQVALGGNWLWVVSLEAAFEVGMKGLRRDPYYLLDKPPSFTDGEIPCDGITIDREGKPPQYFLA